MAKLISVVNTGEGGVPNVFPISLDVKSGTTGSIQPGMLVIKDGSNAGYVAAAPDGTASPSVIVGVAASTSTETASADGTVDVYYDDVLWVEIYAKTPANLVQSMLYSKYILDVTGGNYTLDQATTTNGFITMMDFDNTTDGLCRALLHCSI